MTNKATTPADGDDHEFATPGARGIDVPQRSRERKAAHPTRAQDPVHPPVHGADEDKPWEGAENLAAPEPRPGMAQRWIRVGVHGKDDPTNIAKSFREGWKPRRADTVPEGFEVPTIAEGKYAGVIGVHGMILCEMPKTRVAKRREYFENKTKAQTQAVARDLARVSNPAMPLEQQRKTAVERGREPRVAPDTSEVEEAT